jgi:hypothetical protein
MIACLIKSEDDLERLGLGYPRIEEILLRHGLHYSNEPSLDIAEESASLPDGMVGIEMNGLLTMIQGLIAPFHLHCSCAEAFGIASDLQAPRAVQ